VTCPTATSCTAIAPKHTAGTFYVFATVNGATSVKAASGDQFTYF
jgi:hypothetical protein